MRKKWSLNLFSCVVPVPKQSLHVEAQKEQEPQPKCCLRVCRCVMLLPLPLRYRRAHCPICRARTCQAWPVRPLCPIPPQVQEGNRGTPDCHCLRHSLRWLRMVMETSWTSSKWPTRRREERGGKREIELACGSSYMSTCYINIRLCAWTCLATGVTHSNKFKNLD